MIIIKQGADVDIGSPSFYFADEGANPSAEEADEGVEDGVVTVNNVIYSMRLQPTTFDKKSYLTYLKGYMKRVKEHLKENDPERVKAFEVAAANYAKKIVASFKDWEFYTGDKMDPDAMVVLLNYREDGTTPFLVFFKDGLKVEKVVCSPFNSS
jgi:Translationally controlled tumour protein